MRRPGSRQVRILERTHYCFRSHFNRSMLRHPLAAMDKGLYESIAAAIKDAAPSVHLHAFSPEEVLYGARVSKRPLPEVRALEWRTRHRNHSHSHMLGLWGLQMLAALKAAGVDSLPGTSAEILDDGVRKRLAAARLSSAEWCEVVEAAHAAGIPTTSTMMYGHVETAAEVAGHLQTLREVQAKALARGGPGRITEFVPLSFVAAEVWSGTPIWDTSCCSHPLSGVPCLRPGPRRRRCSARGCCRAVGPGRRGWRCC